MPFTLALAWMLFQSASADVVPADKIASTMKHSAENNILDTKVDETKVKGGIIRVGVIYRKNAEAAPLMHSQLSEIYQIVEGSGVMMTGGTMPNPKLVHDPDNLGPTPTYQGEAAGGVTRRVGPKDVVVVPAGMPHRFISLDGPISYVIYRFEPVPAQ